MFLCSYVFKNINRKICPYVLMSSKTSTEQYVPMSLCLQKHQQKNMSLKHHRKNMFLYLFRLCLHVEQTVFHVDRAISNRRQLLVMCHNHESLSEAIAQIEEKLVQFGLVL